MKPIISSHIRIRYPDCFSVGDDSIIDDFCYFSTQVKVGNCCHIANNCSIAGGRESKFSLGNFCSLSAGVRIWCQSDDFVNDLVIIPPKGLKQLKRNLISGDVQMGNYTAVGSNSVIMPDVKVPDGTVIGAMSFVPSGFKLKPWYVYAGIPVRAIRPRNKEERPAANP